MSVYTQDYRRTGISTSLGKDVLLLQAFEGKESLSELFEYQLDLLSENDDIDPTELVGQPVSFWVEYQDGESRYFHGIVNEFEYLGKGDRLSIYRAKVVPWLWLLNQNQDCRIFQEMSVPDIIADVFRQAGFPDFDVSGIKSNYASVEYCVQYNESDFHFVSRLMEEVGIFYFFDHEEGKHTLKLSDTTINCKECRDALVNCDDTLSQRHNRNEVRGWKRRYRFRPGKWAQTDYNFKDPQLSLLAQTETLVKLSNAKRLEVFEYPGRYESSPAGSESAKRRMEALEAAYDVIDGKSYCRSFSPGTKFKIGKHHHQRERNQSFLVKSVFHKMDATGQFTTGGTRPADGYENEFECLPESAPFRPERKTSRPTIQGTQTAKVVGPADEEIYTDEHGRVKVQFHWDRRGKNDEKSSCWIRVSQVHAGQGWGMMDLPRIGEEVIVSFLEGDPDRPIIVGRVYNGMNMPPFALPAGKTRRGNMTKTYQGAGYNEMSMDDTPGNEQLRVNAMYNMNSNVNNDQTLDVGNNQTEKVAVDRTREVGNNENVTIGVDQICKIGSNNTTTIGSNQSISVGSMKNETVGMMSNEMVGVAKTTNVGVANSIIAGAMMNTAVGFMSSEQVGLNKNTTVGSNYKISAGSSFEITCGGSSIKMDSGGNVTIEGSSQIVLNGGGAKIVMKGGVIDLN